MPPPFPFPCAVGADVAALSHAASSLCLLAAYNCDPSRDVRAHPKCDSFPSGAGVPHSQTDVLVAEQQHSEGSSFGYRTVVSLVRTLQSRMGVFSQQNEPAQRQNIYILLTVTFFFLHPLFICVNPHTSPPTCPVLMRSRPHNAAPITITSGLPHPHIPPFFFGVASKRFTSTANTRTHAHLCLSEPAHKSNSTNSTQTTTMKKKGKKCPFFVQIVKCLSVAAVGQKISIFDILLKQHNTTATPLLAVPLSFPYQ